MIDNTRNLNEARDAFASGDFEKSKLLLDNIIEGSPSSPHSLSARYLRARGYEDGFFGSIEFEKAMEDYSVLQDNIDLYGSDGALGCARVLFEIDAFGNKERIVSLCKQAINRDSNKKAMMLLGHTYDEVFNKPDLAKEWYLRAFKCGMPWGLRYYARMQSRNKKYLSAAFAHTLATVTSPFLVASQGIRSPFK